MNHGIFWSVSKFIEFIIKGRVIVATFVVDRTSIYIMHNLASVTSYVHCLPIDTGSYPSFAYCRYWFVPSVTYGVVNFFVPKHLKNAIIRTVHNKVVNKLLLNVARHASVLKIFHSIPYNPSYNNFRLTMRVNVNPSLTPPTQNTNFFSNI